MPKNMLGQPGQCGVTASSGELRHTNMKTGGKNMTRELDSCRLLKFTMKKKAFFREGKLGLLCDIFPVSRFLFILRNFTFVII